MVEKQLSEGVYTFGGDCGGKRRRCPALRGLVEELAVVRTFLPAFHVVAQQQLNDMAMTKV